MVAATTTEQTIATVIQTVLGVEAEVVLQTGRMVVALTHTAYQEAVDLSTLRLHLTIRITLAADVMAHATKGIIASWLQ